MLLVVGESMVAYQRDLKTGGPQAPFVGPWPSGSPAICAYVAARLGIPTTFVGAVGADRHGAVIRAGLEAGGVDTTALQVRSQDTAWARVTYTTTGDRSFEFHVAGSAATSLRSQDLGNLPERATWCHLSGSALVFGGSLVETVLQVARRAKSAGAKLSVDPNVRPESLVPGLREQLVEVVEMADVVLPSEGELKTLEIDEERLLAGGTVVCSTYGDRGSRVQDATGETQVPAVPVRAVDPDGAGDTFAAAFISGSLRGLTPVEAAQLGANAAAAAVVVHGPMTARFDRLRLTLP